MNDDDLRTLLRQYTAPPAGLGERVFDGSPPERERGARRSAGGR